MSAYGRFCCKGIFGGWTEILTAADASRTSRREGPYRFTQKRPWTFVSAPRSLAAIAMPKIDFREIFGVVQFSTFATELAHLRHAGMSAPWSLSGAKRTSGKLYSTSVSHSHAASQLPYPRADSLLLGVSVAGA